jgi:hypothetical protein
VRGALLPSSGEQVGALSVVLADPDTGRQVTVAGAQLTPGDADQRLSQFAVLFDLLGDDLPAVLASDLGAGVADIAYQQLLGSGFADPDVVLGIERSLTLPADNPVARHDFVLLRGLEPLASSQVSSPVHASDHRLVVVEAGWPR